MNGMGRIPRSLVLFSALLSWIGWAEAQQAQKAGPVAQATNAFAVDLYSKLATAPGNQFFSPFSIETALTMTYAGACGRTAEQMAKVLHLPSSGEEIHPAFGAFIKDLNAEKTPDGKPRGYQLSVANALWGQKGYGFLPPFLSLLREGYGAGLNQVDFEHDAEGARQIINAWVENETKDRIKELIQERILDRLTRLVLTNAIYFKGNWASRFKPKDTRTAPFHKSSGETVDVSMMNATYRLEYMEDNALQVLKMPYEGQELAMIILLPKKMDGLSKLEKSLTAKKLSQWFAGIQITDVAVSLPKFKVLSQFEFKKVLPSMGMRDAFESNADFSGMDGRKDLFISNVIHKAFVEVNEEGSEAAAATAIIMPKEGAWIPTYRFNADHPFIFIICHEKSGAILFMGRVTTLEKDESAPRTGGEEKK